MLFAGVFFCSLAAEDDERPEAVVLRASNGRFITVADGGNVRPTATFPGEGGQFDLVAVPGGAVAFGVAGGGFLTLNPNTGTFRADNRLAEPGSWESFRTQSVGGNSVTLRGSLWGTPVVLEGIAAEPGPGDPAPAPLNQVVEVYRCEEVPEPIQRALIAALKAVVVRELGDKGYSKIRTERTERFITLPAPTLRDPGRKKRHKVLGVREETHTSARLAGTPEIRITGMPYLTGYRDPEAKLVLFALEASLPVRGHVAYKVPKLLSATAGYHTTIKLNVVGEIPVGNSGDRSAIDLPKLLVLDVSLAGLDLSNDVLHTARRPIERAINHEVRKNRERIRAEANEEIREAIEGQKFKLPLLKYLGFG
jgi:hypothetical protein